MKPKQTMAKKVIFIVMYMMFNNLKTDRRAKMMIT
jgi:hypothetical protein